MLGDFSEFHGKDAREKGRACFLAYPWFKHMTATAEPEEPLKKVVPGDALGVTPEIRRFQGLRAGAGQQFPILPHNAAFSTKLGRLTPTTSSSAASGATS